MKLKPGDLVIFVSTGETLKIISPDLTQPSNWAWWAQVPEDDGTFAERGDETLVYADQIKPLRAHENLKPM